jgi:hypothetical protein
VDITLLMAKSSVRAVEVPLQSDKSCVLLAELGYLKSDNELLICKANQVPVHQENGIAGIVLLKFTLMLLLAFPVAFHRIVLKTTANLAGKIRSKVR